MPRSAGRRIAALGGVDADRVSGAPLSVSMSSIGGLVPFEFVCVIEESCTEFIIEFSVLVAISV